MGSLFDFFDVCMIDFIDKDVNKEVMIKVFYFVFDCIKMLFY